MADRTCVVDGCKRKHYAKGMCRRHYSAKQYADDPGRINARNKAWYEVNREKRLAAIKAYQAEHPGYSAEKTRAWRARNPDRARTSERAWYASNRESVIERKRAWRDENREKVRSRAREISAANPERVALKNHRRRQLVTDQADLTRDEWRATVEIFGSRCAYCGVSGQKLEVEHVTPLSRGGRHTASNVVPACRWCNASKGGLTAAEFAARENLGDLLWL